MFRQSPLTAELHSRPAKPVSIFGYLGAIVEPLMMIFALFLFGLPGAIFAQLRHPNPFDWISVFKWKDLILGNGFGRILADADRLYEQIKRPLLSSAYGKVLEVGAGSGVNVSYYDVDKVERLYAMEPYAPLRAKLEKAVEKAGLTWKTTIIPAGLDSDRSLLVQSNIVPESIDTIILFQVLCSIPKPRSHLEFLQSLLKPGGQIIIFEHVASKDPITRILQHAWTTIWRPLMGGCELNRDSGDWLAEIGGWEKVEIQKPISERASDMFPHAVAKFVKKAK